MPVSVKGAIELRKALRAYAPDLAKGLNKEMAQAVKPIVKNAKGYLPSNSDVLRNWVEGSSANGRFPQYDASVAKRGITYKTSPSKRNRRGFRSLVTIFNKSAAGAIYETAGRINPQGRPSSHKSGRVIVSTSKDSQSNNPNAGRMFISNFNSVSAMKGSGKMRGRAIYRAWEEDQGKATAAVMRAIERASATFKARSKVNE